MQTQPCEVTNGYAFGDDVGETVCGKPARIGVNGFPMCAACFAGYEAEGLIESVEPLTVKTVAHDRGVVSEQRLREVSDRVLRGTPAPSCNCGSVNGLPHAHDCPAHP